MIVSHSAFDIYRLQNGWALLLPYWVPTVINAALAAAPWLPWRFSLRTLLITMTLVAVAFGLIVTLLR